jgi:sigma-B regulation protein RsbU (phosphoserine phosphatase)
MAKPTYQELEKRIKDLQRTEQDLYLQKIYFEKLFNSSPEAISLQSDNEIIIDINEEFTKLFGYSSKEAIGKHINDLVLPKEIRDDASLFPKQMPQCDMVEVDSKRRRKDGTQVDVSILCAPITHDGLQMGSYAIYRDITERIKTEEELHIEKTYLESLFNSVSEAIVLHDDNDLVVNVNDEFTRMFGYSREEAIGQPINDLIASEEFKEHATRNSSMVMDGQRTDNDSTRKRKDGTLLDVWIIGAPIIYNGKQMGVYAIYRDITERRKAEEIRIRSLEEARMARNIQINLLPKSNPTIDGYEIAGKSIPALNVGGDYYDFIRLDDHRLAIALGDVSGKGLAAALVMSNLQATIRSLALSNVTANECLERANNLLFRSIDAKTFVSLFYGILDTKKNTICYANAGQNLPLIFSPDKKPIPLKNHGLVLGMKENVSYQKEEIQINPGDRLLIYSDGIPEAMNEHREEFGDENLLKIVQQYCDCYPDTLIENILTTLNLHFGNAPQNDDMTMVHLLRKT